MDESGDVRWAKNYDVLVDAPTTICEFIRKDFTVSGAEFSCVFWSPNGPPDFDFDPFVDACRRIASPRSFWSWSAEMLFVCRETTAVAKPKRRPRRVVASPWRRLPQSLVNEAG